MAHESFEDAETAAVMNDLFVNIKVDREERPDVDAVYMEATQAMTGSGGWPMTVLMTPDGEPFFCGTYFPKESMQGRPGFVDLCRAVDDAWRNRRSELLEQAGRLTEHLSRTSLTSDDDIPGPEVLTAARNELLDRRDRQWGGFGGAPKFPQTMSLELLLRRHATTAGGDPEALEAVITTLDAMASGGIYDHLGGGFSRYSVDQMWLVPHFEKMLYDEALLARTYLHAWQLTDEPRFRQVLAETIGYALRDLGAPAGGFASAEDADSEGVEGRFYVWTPEQLRAVLGDDADAAAAHWGVSDGGNFEGATILNRMHARGRLARNEAMEDVRRRLFEARAQRIRPGLDDKVLTEWNALMCATLAEAGAATTNPTWIDAAVRTAEFLLANLRRADGRWMRSWQAADGGRARHLAYAADYAALVDAFTRLAEATGDARWIEHARATADDLIDLFWDDEGAGFFTTGRDAERLVAHAKDLLDNATPSANSSAAVALLRLAALTDTATYRDKAAGVLSLLANVMSQHPTAVAHLLAALGLWHVGATEIVVVGAAPALIRVVHRRFLPTAVVAWGEPYPSPLWEAREPGHAYVCRNFACRRPATNADDLSAQLET